MFFRISIATILVWAGIASPWLVKDWLDMRSDEAAANRLFEAAVSMPGKVKESLSEPRPKEPTSDATGSSIKPYPIASTTMRVLQGFLPPSMTTTSGSNMPFPGFSSTPSSARSRAVTDLTSEKLSDRLGKLGLKLGNPLFVRIFKEEKELEVWMKAAGDTHFTLFRVYRLRDCSGSLGPKMREGDKQAPEGFYFVGASRLRPDTQHYLGIDLGYPNEFDQAHGREGSDIMIHAGAHSSGSFVLSQDDMNEVFTLADASLRGGQRFFRVNSFPFRMSDSRMAKEWNRQPEWISFWSNLKEGYDFFENANFPPDVVVSSGEYDFQIR